MGAHLNIMAEIGITKFLEKDFHTGFQENSNLAAAESLNSQTNIHIIWFEVHFYKLNFNIHCAPD